MSSMFGTYRYILALMVVIHHLWPGSSPSYIGAYGVYGFYMLSGYLMTLVLNDVYGFSLTGSKKFLINRALRIYPSYLVAMLFSLGIIAITQNILKLQPITIKLQSMTTGEWLSNIFIIGLKDQPLPVVPPAWSLNVEIFFYVTMALFLVRNRNMIVLWFLISLGYTIYMIANGVSFSERYFPIEAASLSFSIGSLIYHLRNYFKNISKWVSLIALIIFILNASTARYLWKDVRLQGFYISIFLSSIILISLINIKNEETPYWLIKTDRFLGDLSYPIFLLHWHVGTLVSWLIFSADILRGYNIFIISFLYTNILAYCINQFIEKKVNKLRDSVRQTKMH